MGLSVINSSPLIDRPPRVDWLSYEWDLLAPRAAAYIFIKGEGTLFSDQRKFSIHARPEDQINYTRNWSPVKNEFQC